MVWAEVRIEHGGWESQLKGTCWGAERGCDRSDSLKPQVGARSRWVVALQRDYSGPRGLEAGRKLSE